MNKKQFKILWAITQISLFVLPFVFALILTPYNISYDKEYVSSVNVRAFEIMDNGKITDFREAVIAQEDAIGRYVEKEWKLQHQEIYYFNNLFAALLIGGMLQMFNPLWKMDYEDYYYDED